MPRPVFPLTPSSSTDIPGKDGLRQAAGLHAAFELPPPAMRDNSQAIQIEISKSSPACPAPCPSLSPISPEAGRSMQVNEGLRSPWRLAAPQALTEATFALPPPPTRSRKIIQMNPRQHMEMQENSMARSTTISSYTSVTTSAKPAETNVGNDKGKKKQSNTANAAGRKIARKTAHSLIERRRRSKMNEEFAVLKNMIPACTGEMHKLAILQASIEYVRYLEDCVAKLKAQHTEARAHGDSVHDTLPSMHKFQPKIHEEPSIAEAEGTDSDTASPVMENQDYRRQASVSPTLQAQAGGLQLTRAAVSSDPAQYNYSLSATTSPAFGPQRHGNPMGTLSDVSISTLTSPMLDPQRDSDHEASAALLMLNQDWRHASAGSRGLSVRDLLST